MGQRYRDFAPGTRLPSTWTDAIEELLTNFVSPNFVLEKASDTTVRIPAGVNDDQVSMAIDGKPRWVEANVVATHPGGAAGDYPVWTTTNADSFADDPGPPPAEIDNTDHSFGLKITAIGGTPSGAGAETHYRRIGTAVWDGAKITSVRSLNRPVAGTGWAVTAGYTADRAFNPEATTLTEIARGLATLIDDLKAAGPLGG